MQNGLQPSNPAGLRTTNGTALRIECSTSNSPGPVQSRTHPCTSPGTTAKPVAPCKQPNACNHAIACHARHTQVRQAPPVAQPTQNGQANGCMRLHGAVHLSERTQGGYTSHPLPLTPPPHRENAATAACPSPSLQDRHRATHCRHQQRQAPTHQAPPPSPLCRMCHAEGRPPATTAQQPPTQSPTMHCKAYTAAIAPAR